MKPLKALPETAPDLTPSKPSSRLRRLRRTDRLRAMVRETHLTPDDFILPLFIEEGSTERAPIKSMPGVFRETEKSGAAVVRQAEKDGLNAVILFGISHKKDARGSDAMKKGGMLDRMVSEAKNASPDMTVIADLCFCEYTDHGHCGVLDSCGGVDNDLTLDNLQRQAVIAAEAGADIIAPSGMMDGAVAAIRSALDESGFPHIAIMSYSSKFASCFYGPFRDAAGCSLGKGNRKAYQMDPANGREAIRESLIDEAEGADILMIKPGMPYLDILAKIRMQTNLPLAAYQVSGEYAMIKYAAQAGALNEREAMMESLLAFKRAGADLILSYFATEVARILQE